MKPERANIGFALMARNAEKTLGPCLQSIRPYVKQIVVGVDVTTTDKTAAVAKRNGADVVFPLKVSDWHECERHNRVLAQDFAAARNATFAKLDPSLEWWAWIDADDTLEGASSLPGLLQNVAPPVLGFWSPYWYAYVVQPDGKKVPNTLFHRERIFRTKVDGEPVSWTWQHRVHEVCTPSIQRPWLQANNLIWMHQHQQHKVEQSVPRNTLLLEIELEETPDDPRTLFYLGNSYFAAGDWANAVEWYERHTRLEVEKHPLELWQAYCYMSMAYERLNDFSAALQAAFGAIDTAPQYPEPYYCLSRLYTLSGQFEKALYWAKEGDGKEDPPFYAFRNPMDRTFNKFMPVADALIELGRVSEAKAALQEAARSFRDEVVLQKIDWCEKKEQATTVAQAYVDLARRLPEDEALALYQQLPEAAKTFGRTRNVAMSVLRKRRSALTQPKIVFWCGRALEPWAPPSLARGIGGSETAVIEIAKRFADAGWSVDVYSGADYMEGEYHGVGYWDPERLKPGEACEVFVSWRKPEAHKLPVVAKQKVLWCHDLNYGPDVAEDMAEWRGIGRYVVGVSQWHADMLARYYGGRHVNWSYVPNGIDPGRFTLTKKVPFQCVYGSSPDRGLVKLLDLWPAIVREEPQARLHIAYGWENIDRFIASGREDLAKLKEHVLKQLEKLGESVVWRGRLPQDELAALYGESYLWLYPTDFLEVSCITAMEAMAGGAVPVTTQCGALAETIGKAGMLLPAPTTSRSYGPLFQQVAVGLLRDTQARAAYGTAGQRRAQELTWDAAFGRWLNILGCSEEGTHQPHHLASQAPERSAAPAVVLAPSSEDRELVAA